jgi:hypothetical protein
MCGVVSAGLSETTAGCEIEACAAIGVPTASAIEHTTDAAAFMTFLTRSLSSARSVRSLTELRQRARRRAGRFRRP